MTKSELIHRLRDQFRDFCGLISIDEIVSNEPLIRVIERIEKMLATADS